jgi:medium-chain acyl-[acyl-carrier-protein] hydrolase
MNDLWFSCFESGARPDLRLFCLPYAGGGAPIFRAWPTRLPPGIAVCPVHLPGRGRRLRESAYRQVGPLVQAIANAMTAQQQPPFAFFGHSMGAIIAFELACHLQKEYGLQPLHLFLSGWRAPHMPQDEPPISHLPEPAFLEQLTRLGGTDQAILENMEMVRLMLPTLRADFELVETYRYAPTPPLNCPITVFGGLADPEANREQLAAWRQHTAGKFALHMLPGDHFFLLKSQDQFLPLLSDELTGMMRAHRGALSF